MDTSGKDTLDNVLFIQLYLPTAHFRIPFTYQRRHTYPIPPYSTIIGFLCNLLGVNNRNKKFDTDELGNANIYDELKKMKISISGNFESKITEMIWFRNLSVKNHEGRFGSIHNRYVNGHIEHIGGQSPVYLDTLNNFTLNLHFYHKNKDVLNYIEQNIKNPQGKLEPLHIGRAEDIFIIQKLEFVSCQWKRSDGNYKNFFWIPKHIYIPNEKQNPFDTIEGLRFNLTTFWDVADYETTQNRHGTRIFQYLSTKLSDGILTNTEFWRDPCHHLPVFPADFEKNNQIQNNQQ